MKKILTQVVKGEGSPHENELWIDNSGDALAVKVFDRGEWKELSGKDSSGGSDGEDEGGGDDTPSAEITPGQGFAAFFDLKHNRYYDKTIETLLPDAFLITDGNLYNLDYVQLEEPITFNEDNIVNQAHVIDEQNTSVKAFDEFSEFGFDVIEPFLEESLGTYHSTNVLFLWGIEKKNEAIPKMNTIGLNCSSGNYEYNIALSNTFAYPEDSAWLPVVLKHGDKLYFSYSYAGD